MVYRTVVAKLDGKKSQLAGRSACPFDLLGIGIEHQAAVRLAVSKKDLKPNNPRSALTSWSEPFDEFEQDTDAGSRSRKNMEHTLGPCAELDQMRLDGWETVASLRINFPPKLQSPRQMPRTFQ